MTALLPRGWTGRRPLKDRFKERFVLSLLSVPADPPRLRAILAHDGDALHPDAAYIFHKQLEEADLLAVNKADLISPEDRRRLEANLTLNARVEMSPEELEQIVRDVLGKVADRHVRAEIRGLRCLRPGRPQPTHRYDKVVD